MRNDLTGKIFMRLTVIRFSHKKNGRDIWECKCTCGSIKNVMGWHLINGVTRSCGCYAREQNIIRHTTHGESRHKGKYGTKEYNCWRSLIKRCDPENKKFKRHYYDRGIRVCQKWKDSYENFLTDVGRCPHSHFSLDRIDNNGNYEPGNVAWVSPKLQTLNRRRKSTWHNYHRWGSGCTQWL